MGLGFNNLRVAKIIPTGRTASVVQLEIPEKLKSAYTFKPGQYISLDQEINGKAIRRAYSICSAPAEEDLSIGVRAIAGGLMSNYLNHDLKVGDMISCSKPEGKFVVKLDQDHKETYLFIAAGSGITPILSMIKSILELEPMSRCFLLYGNQTVETTMFDKELKGIAEKYAGQLMITNLYSRISPSDRQFGRIDKNKLDEYLESNSLNPSKTNTYLCGPWEMIVHAESYLLESRQFPKANIHKEVFYDANAQPSDYALDGKSASTVSVLETVIDGQEIKLEVPADKPILDTLIDAGYDPPYSCMSGACSSCVAKVEEGSAHMDVCFALEDEEIADGYILTCQAKVTSESIKIKY